MATGSFETDLEEYKEGFTEGEDVQQEHEDDPSWSQAAEDHVAIWRGDYDVKSEMWWRGFKDGKSNSWDPPEEEDYEDDSEE